jgi:hypothetical protein
MTPDERSSDAPPWIERANLFLAEAHSIHIDEHGLPCDPSQAGECAWLTDLSLELNSTLADVEAGHARAVRHGAETWLKLVAACRGDRDPVAGAAWIAARGQLPDHWELLGIDPPNHLTDE